MPAPQIILDLIDRFERNKDAYKSGSYNETQVRREFIDPFFEALGWDVNNTSGNAEAYKDVIHEDAVKVSGVTKAPDYSFRIGGQRKFFVEAKQPSINIKDAPAPAFQVRRYAWSGKLPLSIVTDFDEFAVYDCRIRPDQADKSDKARIKYYTYKQYAEKWDEIASIFSKDAILKGSFDKYAESTKAKRGTAEVDSAFLAEIEIWREQLARNIALRNTLTVRELNDSVQRIIDRIIFLRIAEDRGIEDYGALRGIVNGANIYSRLQELFYKADERYNSGLFHFRPEKGETEPPDRLTPDLVIDDKPLKDILKTLYYPDSPYEFAVLPADILGQVYEQFLGKVIRLSSDHRAVVEDKPEVKKAGGVFYTPTYIVDYIVQNTVGKLLDGKTPKKAESLRILDPACGSGSFLLGAYQYLLDWHLKYYAANNPEKHAREKRPALYSGQGGAWHLTTAERKRILLNNIYGVDIDSQAVEVTKLSLLLKVLEDETGETLNRQRKLFHERALPNLGGNIKCGNSLIGPDFYDGKQMNLLDPEEAQRVNVFDWQTEFPEIFKTGGFDAVIGNPPWGALFEETELEYLRHNNNDIIVRMIDSFMYFVYKSSKVIRTGGNFGMILPDVLLYQTDNRKLREFLLNNFKIINILNMGNVFDKVTRPACILILEQGHSFKQIVKVLDLSESMKADKPFEIWDEQHYLTLSQNRILNIPASLFITSNITQYEILTKIQKNKISPLHDLVDDDGIQRGVSPDLKEAFIVNSEITKKLNFEAPKLRKVLTGGKQVRKYFTENPNLLLIYTRRNDNFKELPNICKYIDQFKEQITCKEVKQNKHPIYALHRAREESIFLKEEKLIGVITGDAIILALDKEQYFVTDGLYLFGVRNIVNIRYLMGVLNSELFIFIYRLLTLEKGRVLAQVKPTILEQLPIRNIDFSNTIEKKMHDRMVQLVEQMLALHKQLAETKTGHEQTLLQRQIDVTDKQIDKLVYELYDLTPEEIAIVEKSGV
jgi:type I restriction-modification system DNA methylase subunit/predicted type IV restriction endonuclease